MAATAQAEWYDRLLRKIGQSVGLEEMVKRVDLLVALYRRDRSLSPGSFGELVEVEYGRKRNAAPHFGAFFKALNLMSYSRGSVEPLYQLESLAILRGLFPTDDRKYNIALKVVLSQCIIEEDGDIFLNALLADFRPAALRGLLEAMLRAKRADVTGDMRTPHLLRRIVDVLSIRTQVKGEASGESSAATSGRFARRTVALGSLRRTGTLTPGADLDDVSIPEDYLDKATVTRKGWAQDLGYFGAEGKTREGNELIQQLVSHGVVVREAEQGAILFWGYSLELDRLRSRLQIKLPHATTCKSWDLLNAVTAALREDARSSPAPDADSVMSLLERVLEAYKENNASKGLIRNSLPLYIAEPVLAGWCLAENMDLPDLDSMLEAEYRRTPKKRVQRMIIRGTEGALFFMR